VDVIVGVAPVTCMQEDMDVVAQVLGDVVVLLDRLLPFQDGRPDAVDVCGRGPHMRRWGEGEFV
jgi:hypothetical protein